VSGDVHSPTNAGPDLGPQTSPAWTPPAAAAAEPSDNPEAVVGAAFAGGLIAAFILKRLVRR
jgi:hypothetical protein